MSDRPPPSVGRIVWAYLTEKEQQSRGLNPFAAIITGVDPDGCVDLTLFLCGGIEYRSRVPYSIDGQPGSWSWPKLK